MKRAAWLPLIAACLVLAGCSKKTANTGVNTNPTATTPSTTSTDQGHKQPDKTPPAATTSDNTTFIWSDVYFAYDDATLGDDARQILAATGAHMQKSSEHVTIEGNCDERGSVEYNLALGERRAGSVKDYLVSYGITGDRMQTVSYGKEKPVDPGHDESAWAKNRRAHFVVNQ